MCNIVRYLYDCGCCKEVGDYCPVKCHKAATWSSHKEGRCSKYSIRYWATDATSQNHGTAADASVSRELRKVIHHAETALGVWKRSPERKLQCFDRRRSALVHMIDMIDCSTVFTDVSCIEEEGCTLGGGLDINPTEPAVWTVLLLRHQQVSSTTGVYGSR